MDFVINPLTIEERKYTYAQSSQLKGQTGSIGHLRGDFGSGEQFYTSWFEHNSRLKTSEFSSELDDVINELRNNSCGLLKAVAVWWSLQERTLKAPLNEHIPQNTGSGLIRRSSRIFYAATLRRAIITSIASVIRKNG